MIEKYFCSCLNVTINTTVGDARKIAGIDLVTNLSSEKINLSDLDNLNQDEQDINNADPFFSSELLEVKLAISGIEVAQSVLSKERHFGDWVIFTCLNCGQDTHTVHAVKGLDRVLLSQKLDHGNELMLKKKHSATYSSVFKLLILDSEAALQNNGITLQQRNMLEATDKLNDQMKKSTRAEQRAMTERIRIFSEKQERQFLEFKKKANADKEQLISSLNRYETSNDSLFDSINESYFGNPFTESRDLSTELPQIKGRPVPIRINETSSNNTISAAQSVPAKILTSPNKPKLQKGRIRTKSNNSNRSPFRNRTLSSENDDTLFDLDGFHDGKNCEPFFESDDESSGDATSLESSGGYGIPSASRGLNPGDRVYATSVPIGIPFFSNMKNSYEPEESEEEEEEKKGAYKCDITLEKDTAENVDDEVQEPNHSPSYIADSIKALARSMQDSTRIFGELPRDYASTRAMESKTYSSTFR